MSLLDHNRRAERFWASLVMIGCIFGLLADVALYATGHWHGKFFPGLYAVTGFVAYCSIVFTAKGTRALLSRDEDYYGEAPEHDRPIGDAQRKPKVQQEGEA